MRQLQVRYGFILVCVFQEIFLRFIFFFFMLNVAAALRNADVAAKNTSIAETRAATSILCCFPYPRVLDLAILWFNFARSCRLPTELIF